MDPTTIAEQMAQFLTTVDSRSYSRKHPLQELMESEITRIARQIAIEVVAATPELREVLQRKTLAVIQKAMHEDAFLNDVVTGAVAKALSSLALSREEEGS